MITKFSLIIIIICISSLKGMVMRKLDAVQQRHINGGGYYKYTEVKMATYVGNTYQMVNPTGTLYFLRKEGNSWVYGGQLYYN